MEIFSSKFKSPPPKPPRRRYSDQMSSSSAGSYLSGRKRLERSGLNSRHLSLCSESDATSYTSLPTNLVGSFSTDNIIQNSLRSYDSVLFSSPDKDSVLRNSNIKIETNKCKRYIEDCNPALRKKECSNLILDESIKTVSDSNRLLKNNIYSAPSETSLKSKILSKEYTKDTQRLTFDKKNAALKYTDSGKQLNLESSHSCVENAFMKVTSQKNRYDSSPDFENPDESCSSLCTENSFKNSDNLQEEIKILKEMNTKLWKHLCVMQEQIEKVKTNPRENLDDDSVSMSELLSSMYYLQKTKDSIMEDRLRSITQERDTTVREMQEVVQVIARNFEDGSIECDSDSEINELLKEIDRTYNPAQLLHQQRLLLSCLYHSKELKKDHIMHELKITVAERDSLRDQVTLLEEELRSIKLSNEIWSSDNKYWEKNLLSLLCKVLHQRDRAISHPDCVSKENFNRSTKNEIFVQDTNQDNVCSDQMTPVEIRKLFTCQNDFKYDIYSIPSSEENPLVKGKLAMLSKTLEMEIEKRALAESKCLRLERLVSVLQKKISGQSVGVQV